MNCARSATINVLQFICPTGFYGAERWILALARHLDPQQVRCDLVTTNEPELGELEITRQYRKLGLEAFEVPMSHKFDLGAVNRLVALIKERNIHVIHTHGYKSDILGVLAARKAGIPCIVTPHGFENAKDIKLRMFIWLGCQAMKWADKVVPLSHQLMEDVARIGVKKDKVLYIQNGVDLSEVEAAKAEYDAAPPAYQEQRIGFIGQMISRKNIYDILDTFEALQATHPNTRLVLLGDGDERQALEEYTARLASKDKIEFLGFRDDRLALLCSFDLFVMTSTLEGIPRCLMEACAAKVPVAAYDIAGIDQLITHQQSGLLAQLGDKETLLSYWKQLLDDKVLAEKVADAAHTFVYDNYSGQRMAQEYTQLFAEVVRIN